jgi:hypothetical protein
VFRDKINNAWTPVLLLLGLCGIGSISGCPVRTTNPHLNGDPGTIIAFPDETFGLKTLNPGCICIFSTSVQFTL